MNTKQKIYSSVKTVTPPFIFSAMKKSFVYESVKKYLTKKTKKGLVWNKISGGILAGSELPFKGDEIWQKEMLDGIYDSYFFDFLETKNLVGKTIFEIGAHIGYHALAFSKIVGPQGKVVAFEPNPENISYIKEVCLRNKKIGEHIDLIEAAVSSKDGEEIFISSDEVDQGLSSGGFIESANTMWDKKVYETETGFTRSTVKTITLDSFVKEKNVYPDIIKIDIEGSEGQMLEGAKDFLSLHSPIILVEVHSIKSMYDVLTLLKELEYSWDILKKEEDGRCFLVCEKK